MAWDMACLSPESGSGWRRQSCVGFFLAAKVTVLKSKRKGCDAIELLGALYVWSWAFCSFRIAASRGFGPSHGPSPESAQVPLWVSEQERAADSLRNEEAKSNCVL